MSEWKEVLVKDLIADKVIAKPLDGNHGGTHPKGSDFVASGIPFIMATDINNGKVDLYNCKFITENQANNLRKGFSIEGDVLLTHKASLGRTAIVPKITTPYIMLTPQVTYYRVINPDILNNIYLKYYFDSPFFQETLNNHGDAGSTRAYVGITAQQDLPVILPPLPEQKAIASVLTSLDDKIDLLHQQNQTLEKMAETLFRQWFIEEADDDWEEGVIPDEFNIIMGQSPKGSSFNEDKVGTPMFQGSTDFGFRFPKNRVYTTEPKRFALPLDTLMSVRAPVGAQNMAKEKICIGRGLASFRSLKNPDWYTYTYYKINFLMSEIKKFNNEGTVFGSIGKNDIGNIKVTIPSDDVIESFEKIVKPMNDKIIKNSYQIQTLENLRDTLLPKLMSGEVSVDYQC
ncbi:restriction endonuclease subunit S [Psychrobacter sp. I-STPA6b]|uniref:restriction endonuclease subunit S n=1 Tax=Psychrobacter sp. I-STPA6b TaxID=2585718 RepID=UPI001D0C6A94|nr:restriction endonuclease subunit S [Psychrobacter sp. I-STPA6b]